MNDFEFIITLWLLGLSVCLQFMAACIALWLINVTGRTWAWTMIAAAVFLMGVRRSITFARFLTEERGIPLDLTAETIALVISIMMFTGLARITPLFRSLSITNKKLLESKQTLQSSEQLLQSVLDTVPVRVFWKDLQSRYLGCNIHAAHDAGLDSTDDIIGKDDYQLAWSEQAKLYRSDDQSVMVKNKAKIDYEELQSRTGDTETWLKTSKVPLVNGNGDVYGVLGTYEDITERKRSEELEKILFQLLEYSFEPIDDFLAKSIKEVTSIPWLSLEEKGEIFLVDNDHENPVLRLVCSHNLEPALTILCATDLLGQCLCGKTVESKEIQFIAGVDEQYKNHYQGILQHDHYNVPLMHGDQLLGVMLLYVKQGLKKQKHEIQFLERVSHILGLGISKHKAELQVKHQAYYDPVTGFPNRYLLLDRLQQAYAWSRRHNMKDALIFIDIDRFKHINDSLGHAVGDQLLKQVALRINSMLREEDTLARLGGDEFVVLVKEIAADKEKAIAEISIILEKFQASFKKALSADGHELFVTLSCGIAIIPDDGDDANLLLRNADAAMYQAKHLGRNTFAFYSDEMQKRSNDRRLLEADLRQAIQNNQFTVYYQPQVNDFNQIIGAEALLNWQHPNRGSISPTIFIPIAEESGLILEIGNWVMNTACSQFKIFCESDTAGLLKHIAVNVSAHQFHHQDFFQHVEKTVTQNELQSQQLTLELTESVMIANTNETVKKMHQLKMLGVNFSIDDFGTGYSSLNYLKNLPLDQLKIDKSFIDDIDTDPNDKIIIETIISMSRHLNLDVIAEGVENKNQLSFLHQAGCFNFQGFLYSRPLVAEEFIALLSNKILSAD